MSKSRWIAVYTKTHQESIAVENIRRQSFEAYCPMLLRTRRHARKTEQIKRPLFPSYVFVRLDLTRDQWRPLLSTRGVQSLVRFGERVGILPEAFVEDLRSYDQNGNLHQMVAPKVKPGDQITISDGPFKTFIGKVLSAPEKDRVWLLLDMMGRQVRICQDISTLIPA